MSRLRGRVHAGLAAITAISFSAAFLPFLQQGHVRVSLFGALRSANRIGVPLGRPWIAPMLAVLVTAGFGFAWFSLCVGRRSALHFVPLWGVILLLLGCVAIFVSRRLLAGNAILPFVGLILVAGYRWGNPDGVVEKKLPRGFVANAVGCGGILVGALAAFVFFRSPVASSPRAAASALRSALNRDNWLAFAELVDPSEREAVMRTPGFVHELRRLHVLESLSDAPAAASSERRNEERGGIAVEKLRLPTVKNELAIASFEVPALLPKTLASILNADAADCCSMRDAVIIRRGNGWYFSITHTVANRVVPTYRYANLRKQHRIEPNGAPNPEAAVRALFISLTQGDLNSVLASLDPNEGDALYAYGLAYLQEAERWRRWSADNAVLDVSNTDLRATGSNSEARVAIDRLIINLKLPSDLGAGSSVDLDGDCVVAKVEAESSRHCGRQIPQVIADLFGVKAPDLGKLEWLRTPQREVSFVVLQRNGVWFIAPIRSMLATAALQLSHLEPSDLQGRGRTLSDRLAAARSLVDQALHSR